MPRLTIAQKEERTQEAADLRKRLPPGSTIHILLRHTSGQGTQYFDVYYIAQQTIYNSPLTKPTLIRLTYGTHIVTGYRYDRKREAIRTTNWHDDLARALSYALYGNFDSLQYERI